MIKIDIVISNVVSNMVSISQRYLQNSWVVSLALKHK